MEKEKKKKEEKTVEPLLDPWIFEEAKEKVEIVPLELEMPKPPPDDDKKASNTTSSIIEYKSNKMGDYDDSLMSLQQPMPLPNYF